MTHIDLFILSPQMLLTDAICSYIRNSSTSIVEIEENDFARTFTNRYLKQFTIIINLTFAAAFPFAL